MNAAENALYCIIQQRCIKTVSNLQVGNIVQVMSPKTFQGLYIPIISLYGFRIYLARFNVFTVSLI